MDALTLKKLYESQLQEDLKCPATPDFNRREVFYMLRLSRRMNPGALYGHDHAGTWVWSDLHLGHTKTIEAFGRPFGAADEMNWRRTKPNPDSSGKERDPGADIVNVMWRDRLAGGAQGVGELARRAGDPYGRSVNRLRTQ